MMPPRMTLGGLMMRFMMKMAATTCLLLLLPTGALADTASEVREAAKEAMALFEKGDMAGAAGQFDYAAQLIRQKKAGDLATLLPPAPSGWTAEAVETEAMGTAMMGGGVHASRTYLRGDDNMELSIMADSPMVQSMAAMVQNPTLIAASGGKLEKVGDYRAAVKYEAETKSGEVTLIVDNRILVSVKSEGASRDEMMALLNKLDLAKLAKN